MGQTVIDLPNGDATPKIYHIINSQEFADDYAKSKQGNKSAKRRLRKQLLQIAKLTKTGRKELQNNT